MHSFSETFMLMLFGKNLSGTNFFFFCDVMLKIKKKKKSKQSKNLCYVKFEKHCTFHDTVTMLI